MPTARDRLTALRRRARRPGAPAGAAVAPSPESTVAWATRSLLRAESTEDVAGIVAEAIDQLGGTVVAAERADDHALPLDVGFGLAEPMLPTAEPGSPALAALTRHLPALVADARRAIDTIVRTAHLSASVARDATTGLATRATFTRELARLRDDDTVVVVRVSVPESPRGTDDDLHEAVVAFAAHLHDRLAPGDHAARIEEDELGILLHRPGTAGTAVLLTRLRQDWARLHPQVPVHVGVAGFRGSGAETLRAAYDALDVELATSDDASGTPPAAERSTP